MLKKNYKCIHLILSGPYNFWGVLFFESDLYSGKYLMFQSVDWEPYCSQIEAKNTVLFPSMQLICYVSL